MKSHVNRQTHTHTYMDVGCETQAVKTPLPPTPPHDDDDDKREDLRCGAMDGGDKPLPSVPPPHSLHQL